MVSLSTTYLGLTMKSPVIVSSSGLSNTTDKIRKMEEEGAGAVVLKSLFEEQINYEAGTYVENSLSPEAYDYVTAYSKANALHDYLKLIEDAKKTVSMPVIASINCMSSDNWIRFAKNIEQSGADALELNVFYIASEINVPSEKLENLYNEILLKVKSVTRLPVAIKLGFYFTNLVNVVNNLYIRGAKGVVLFNRFYEPDIDIDKMEMTAAGVISKPSDMHQSLRWTGIISDRVSKIDIAASTGIHDGKAAIKQLLAGARAVEICSVLYEKGFGQIRVILDEMTEWMEEKKMKNIDDFRGKLNYKNVKDPSAYERSQFMKYFSAYS